MTPVLAVDPGGRESGVVLRHGEALAGYAVVVRHDTLKIPDGDYVTKVLDVCSDLATDDSIVAVESVRFWPQEGNHVCPACRKRHDPRARNLQGLLGTAVVLGAVLARWPDAVVVAPGKRMGSLHDIAYPEPIRATGKGKDLLRHCRSAWDLSFHGETLWKQRRRGMPA